MPSVSISAASGATVLPADRATLRRRLATAAILAPIAIVAVWIGGLAWLVAITALVGAGLWEWARMTTPGPWTPAGIAMVVATAAVPVSGLLGAPSGLGVLIVCSSAAALLGRRAGNDAVATLGTLYLGSAAIGLIWLRELPQAGFGGALWLLLAVWAADSGAYLVGRTVGGPKLAPRISPHKTWSGLVGSMLGAALVGAILGWLWEGSPPTGRLAAVSVVVGLVGQVGDLLESLAKRRFGVKDSSNLLPGHGGVLDRVDALMSAALMVAAAYLLKPDWLAWS